MVDGYLYCMYFGTQGGAWRYSCGNFPDNSAAQWGAIGIIPAVRGFGSVVPPLAYDWNEVWLNYSQNTTNGVFGYTNTSPVWGPYATTPSGMVQLAMDGIGRGDARWNKAETFIRDNFCNAPTGYASSIKSYYYGLFSFTKAMLFHAPGGTLTPIRLLQSQTSGVPPIDWYAAEGSPCDGVARFLVTEQNPAGYWNNTQAPSGEQRPFSTGFAIVMLRRTVVAVCPGDSGVDPVQGRGTPSGRGSARVDLTWGLVAPGDTYRVLRGTTHLGPYNSIGIAATNSFSDTVGLTNGSTYYYVVSRIPAGGSELCQSNEARVTIPAGR
jgi:hypothetical protein